MNDKKQFESRLEKLMELTEGRFDAFLYDCDGTLADNMQLHKDAYVDIALRHGLVLDAGIIDELAGWPTVQVVGEINKRYHSNIDVHAFAKAKSAIFKEVYIEQTQPIDFVVAHLLEHVGKTRIGVVSGGSRNTVKTTLNTLGIFDKIEVLVCSGETEHGKPWPDPFLKAAELLQVEPSRCMVFEDGDAGVKGAEAAGMQWIRIDWI